MDLVVPEDLVLQSRLVDLERLVVPEHQSRLEDLVLQSRLVVPEDLVLQSHLEDPVVLEYL
jgi:hypothetical protein